MEKLKKTVRKKTKLQENDLLNEIFTIWREYTKQKENIKTNDFSDNQEEEPREREICLNNELRNWAIT